MLSASSRTSWFRIHPETFTYTILPRTYIEAGTILNNYSNVFSLITRMRQMACHVSCISFLSLSLQLTRILQPDLVLKSRRNVELSGDIVEATVCRLCNDVAEDAVKSKCHHVFDRECIKQYINTAVEVTVRTSSTSFLEFKPIHYASPLALSATSTYQSTSTHLHLSKTKQSPRHGKASSDDSTSTDGAALARLRHLLKN